jgi:sortase A
VLNSGKSRLGRLGSLVITGVLAMSACGDTASTPVTADVLEPIPAQAAALRDAPELVVTAPRAPAASTIPATTAPTTTSTSPAEATTTTVPGGGIGSLDEPGLAASASAEQADDLPVPHPPPDPNAETATPPLFQIRIPKVGLDQTVFAGVTTKALDGGPGHWPGTPMPGQLGNMVIAGHRTSHTRPFYDLDLLEPGDEVLFTDGNGTAVYRVTTTEFVTPDALWITDPTPDATATLFACHPKGSTRQRIVVRLAYIG